MAHVAMESGASGGTIIEMDPAELTTIINHMNAIIDQFVTVITPGCETLKSIEYYAEGEAKEVMQKYKEIIDRTNEVLDLYNSGSALVYNIMETMIATDQNIAQKIGEGFVVYNWMGIGNG